MFKQLQEAQRQNKLQESNDSREQNAVNQLSLTHDKQSSRSQFGFLNNGIRVRDPSQMFMFGDTNWVHGFSNRMGDSRFLNQSHESAGLLTKNQSQQARIFCESFVGFQSSGLVTSVYDNLSNKEDDNCLATKSFKNMFAKTENSTDFHSIQSGTSSVLMQSAVADASSSDQNQHSNLVQSGNHPKTGDYAGMSVFMDKSPTFPAPNSRVDEEHIDSVSKNEVRKSESDDAFTPSYDNNNNNNNNNASQSPYVGLRLTTQSQRPLVNYFDPSRISQQTVHFSKPSLCPKSENNQLSNQNYTKLHLVSVKNEDGQRWSTGPADICLGAPVQQNPSVTGSCELPCTSYTANSRVRNTCSVHLQQLDVANQNMGFSKSKKRKFSTFECLRWHNELTEGSSRLHDTSSDELEWARSVVRLPEKVEELADEIAGSCRITNQKRRLRLTTQLMQLLFRPPPAIVLSGDAITHCDIVTYYASKLALGDVCCIYSSAGKNMTSKSSSDQDLLKIIEGFIDRSKRLKDDVSRLEKGESLILELMMDFQDLEKFSFINRFAKFHTRGPAATGDRRSSTMQKRCPQRYVKANPMPNVVPEGQNCLFL